MEIYKESVVITKNIFDEVNTEKSRCIKVILDSLDIMDIDSNSKRIFRKTILDQINNYHRKTTNIIKLLF